jgi:DNA-binding response OmpR family regulator
MRVLLVEDDDRIASDIVAALAAGGFVVLRERDGQSGWSSGGSDEFAATILDLGLPYLDGLSVLRRWREEGVRTPVLVLSARGSWIEKVEGMNAGADDYLAKPFHMEELVARLRALVRRSVGVASSIQHIGDIIIDMRQQRVASRGRSVSLTPHELRALNYLVAHRGRVISHSELIDHVHGAGEAVTNNALEALVGRIRRKLGAELIETRRGFGYVVSDRQR